jgi:hypothetical protein
MGSWQRGDRRRLLGDLGAPPVSSQLVAMDRPFSHHPQRTIWLSPAQDLVRTAAPSLTELRAVMSDFDTPQPIRAAVALTGVKQKIP